MPSPSRAKRHDEPAASSNRDQHRASGPGAAMKALHQRNAADALARGDRAGMELVAAYLAETTGRTPPPEKGRSLSPAETITRTWTTYEITPIVRAALDCHHRPGTLWQRAHMTRAAAMCHALCPVDLSAKDAAGLRHERDDADVVVLRGDPDPIERGVREAFGVVLERAAMDAAERRKATVAPDRDMPWMTADAPSMRPDVLRAIRDGDARGQRLIIRHLTAVTGHGPSPSASGEQATDASGTFRTILRSWTREELAPFVRNAFAAVDRPGPTIERAHRRRVAMICHALCPSAVPKADADRLHQKARGFPGDMVFQGDGMTEVERLIGWGDERRNPSGPIASAVEDAYAGAIALDAAERAPVGQAEARMDRLGTPVQVAARAKALATWMVSGDTGSSSETLASALMRRTLGEAPDPGSEQRVPRDAQDLGRCIRMVETLGADRVEIGRVTAGMGAAWSVIGVMWPRLVETHKAGDEAAVNMTLDGIERMAGTHPTVRR